MGGVQHPLSFPVPTEQVWDELFPRDGLTDNGRDAYPALCVLPRCSSWGRVKLQSQCTGHEYMKEQISHCTWCRWESASVVTTGRY